MNYIEKIKEILNIFRKLGGIIFLYNVLCLGKYLFIRSK